MKILVAYDGSSYADAAIDDLQWAGLPQDADAIVLSAVEWPLQSPRSWGMVDTGFPAELEAEIKAAEVLRRRVVTACRSIFRNGRSRRSVRLLDTHQRPFSRKPRTGPRTLSLPEPLGRSGLARVVLGSVSLKLVHEATCSVRIARARQSGLPIRLVIGDDGSAEAEAAVAEVSRRTWPAGTEVRVVAVHQFLLPVRLQMSSWIPRFTAKSTKTNIFG